MEQAIFANICLIYNDKNQVVIQYRNNKYKGVSFPGGHVEKGESMVDSVKREVLEETGLTVDNLQLCGVKNWYKEETNTRHMIFLYKTSTYSGTLTSSIEGEVKWIPFNDLFKENLAFKDFDTMLKVFLEDYTEMIYVEDEGYWHTYLK